MTEDRRYGDSLQRHGYARLGLAQSFAHMGIDLVHDGLGDFGGATIAYQATASKPGSVSAISRDELREHYGAWFVMGKTIVVVLEKCGVRND
jgi:hypothetical protein